MSVGGFQSGRQDAGLGELRTRRSSCGTWRRARNRPPSRDTRNWCIPWRSVRTARRWPRGARTGRSSCGTWRRARNRPPSRDTPASCTSVAFSPDGKTLASGSNGQDDQVVGRRRGQLPQDVRQQINRPEPGSSWPSGAAGRPEQQKCALARRDRYSAVVNRLAEISSARCVCRCWPRGAGILPAFLSVGKMPAPRGGFRNQGAAAPSRKCWQSIDLLLQSTSSLALRICDRGGGRLTAALSCSIIGS